MPYIVKVSFPGGYGYISKYPKISTTTERGQVKVFRTRKSAETGIKKNRKLLGKSLAKVTKHSILKK